MLIFGLRVCYHTTGTGTFHCQRCGGDRQYRQRAGRRWFHLLLIPVIPLGHAGEHVQCVNCGVRYRTGVLAVPTSAQMEAALPAGTLAAAVCMLLAGDPASEPAAGLSTRSGPPGWPSMTRRRSTGTWPRPRSPAPTPSR